jgi:hypothetical protein
MNINRAILLVLPIIAFLLLTIIARNSNSCEPEKYPPPPELIWPPDQAKSVPIDSALIVKDYKSISKTPHKLEMELLDSSGNSVDYKLKRYQSRRSVYNHEAGFIFLKPLQRLKPLEGYSFTVKAKEGFAEPFEETIKFSTGDENTLVTDAAEIDVTYFFSEPGYYLSNCQTSTWDKATSLFFINSKVEGYPLLLVLDSNLLKDISFFHPSMNKRDLAVLFLPNEKGIDQCFDLSAFSVNGRRVFGEAFCKPDGCVKGRYLSKEEAEEEYKKHGAFGFSLIEFPPTKEEIPNYCTLYPPLCREYWSSLPGDKCEGS